MAVHVGKPEPPEVLGLPTDGAMGKEPAMTVSTIMAIVGGAVAAGSQLIGYEVPPDVQAFANDWGAALAGAFVAAWAILQGRLIRPRVVSPATTLNLIRKMARPTGAGRSGGTIIDGVTGQPSGHTAPPPGPFN